MPRNRCYAAELRNEQGRSLCKVDQAKARSLVARGVARITEKSTGRVPRISVIELMPPAPPPSDSFPTPTTLTYNDMQINAGLPPDGRDFVSRETQRAVHDKVETWSVRSWSDRCVAAITIV